MNRLKYFRRLRGMTQQELSEKSGVGRVTISRIENGKHQISTSTVMALATVLDCRAGDLMGDDEYGEKFEMLEENRKRRR